MTTIRRTEVRTYQEHLMCNCGNEMVRHGPILTSMPPLYSYRCDNCGVKTNSNESYPRVVTEEVEVQPLPVIRAKFSNRECRSGYQEGTVQAPPNPSIPTEVREAMDP